MKLRTYRVRARGYSGEKYFVATNMDELVRVFNEWYAKWCGTTVPNAGPEQIELVCELENVPCHA